MKILIAGWHLLLAEPVPAVSARVLRGSATGSAATRKILWAFRRERSDQRLWAFPAGAKRPRVLWASHRERSDQGAVGFQPGAKRPEDCVLPAGAKRPEDCVLPAGAKRPEAVAFPPGTERSRTVCFPAGAKRPEAVGSEVSQMRCSVLRAPDGSEATWGLKRLVMFFYRSFLIEILIISSLRYQRTTFSISNERYKP